jgi:hypothetical protein
MAFRNEQDPMMARIPAVYLLEAVITITKMLSFVLQNGQLSVLPIHPLGALADIDSFRVVVPSSFPSSGVDQGEKNLRRTTSKPLSSQ